MHRREPFDVLHALWATEPGMLAAVAGRLLGIPVVVGIAGGELVALRDAGYGGQLARDDRVKSRVALRLADVVTGGSRYMCELAAPWAAALPLPLGIDTELFAPEPGGLSDPPRLVHAGSLVPVKDQATLLRALAALRDRGVAFSAELAGEGYLEPELRALAESLGLAEHVRFLGALPHHELPAFYRGAAAFVLSSLHEAQCMAVLEAAACGVPTVGTAVGVAPELAPEAALTVPPRDPAALAAALHTLLRDDRRRAAMGLAALGIARGEYALECFAARARTVYAEARRRRGLLPQRPQSAAS
jgi:glycosyltransferase involved in cell wall biosynthesis